MDENFLSSVFSTPPKILGRQLKPFSCSHAAVLYSLNSPFVLGGKISPDEVCIAVWVCSFGYNEIQSLISDEVSATSGKFKVWIKSIIDDCDINEANQQFQKYLEDHLKAPARWKKENPKGARVPWPLTIATNLMRELKFSEEKAWDLSMPLALWYFAAIADAEGDESIISEDEKEAMKTIRTQEAVI